MARRARIEIARVVIGGHITNFAWSLKIVICPQNYILVCRERVGHIEALIKGWKKPDRVIETLVYEYARTMPNNRMNRKSEKGLTKAPFYCRPCIPVGDELWCYRNKMLISFTG